MGAKDGIFTEKVEFLVDEFANKGTPPSAMGISAKMEIGGEGKFPNMVVTISSESGKGPDVKGKVDHLVEVLLDKEQSDTERKKENERCDKRDNQRRQCLH